MDKFRLSGCIKLIALDAIRLVIVLAVVFIIGVYSTAISSDNFPPMANAQELLVSDQNLAQIVINGK